MLGLVSKGKNANLFGMLPKSDAARYVLFSIGNVKPLFAAAFKNCWGKASSTNHLVCNTQWLNAVEYLEICGIIVGQILVGILGDW